VGRRPFGESFCTSKEVCSNALAGIPGADVGELIEGVMVVLGLLIGESWTRFEFNQFNAWVGCAIITTRVPNLCKLRIASGYLDAETSEG
jgi:hypothetical protein